MLIQIQIARLVKRFPVLAPVATRFRRQAQNWKGGERANSTDFGVEFGRLRYYGTGEVPVFRVF